MMRHTVISRRSALGTLCVAFGAAAIVAASGCSLLHGSPGGVLTLSGVDGTRTFAPDYSTAAYRATDADTADVYLSDIAHERLTNPSDTLAGAVGNIVHIHIFLSPDAGNTPIDSTACNFTVRHLVLAGGTADAPIMGLYAGGGFLATSGTIGGGGIGGAVSAASERLNRSTPAFKDLLGAASLSGRFSAPEDDQLADAMSGKLELLASRLPQAQRDEEPKALPVKKPAPAKGEKKKDEKKGDKPGAEKKPEGDAKPAK